MVKVITKKLCICFFVVLIICSAVACGKSNAETPKDIYLRVDSLGNPKSNGEFIEFGEYPQSVKIDSVSVGSKADEDGYYEGSDGARYAKIVSSVYESDYKFKDGNLIGSGTYYFKVEPIVWKIIDRNNENATILSCSVIDGICFNKSKNEIVIESKTIFSSNYEQSYIRNWLNNDFYYKAFSEQQQNLIIKTEVDNSKQSSGANTDKYESVNTNDNIYLISFKDVTNVGYGFNANSQMLDSVRMRYATDFSRARGVKISKSLLNYGAAWWWTRSTEDSTYCKIVASNGGADYFSEVTMQSGGVVPTLNIKLSD